MKKPGEDEKPVPIFLCECRGNKCLARRPNFIISPTIGTEGVARVALTARFV